MPRWGQSVRTHGVAVSALLPPESIRVTVTLLQDQSLCQLEDGVSARGQRGSHTNHSLQAFRHLPAVTVMVPSLSRWAGRTVASLCTGTYAAGSCAPPARWHEQPIRP